MELRQPGTSVESGHSSWDYGLVVAYVLGGASIPFFLRYLGFYFDTLTMNFYRMTSGAATMLFLCLLMPSTQLFRTIMNGRTVMGAALLSAILFLPAYLLTEGIRQTSATVAALMGLLSIPIAGFLACLFFRDERQAVRNRRFLLGAGLAFLGATVVVLGTGNLNLAYSVGVFYVFAAYVLYVVAALLSKRLVRNVHPLSLATLCCCWSSLFFLAGTLLRGDIKHVADVPGQVVFWLVFSGVVGLLAGIAINFAIVKRRGIITLKVAELSMPLFTGLWSFLWLNEALQGVQVLGGCVVTLGCAILLSSRPKTAPPPLPD